MRATSTLFRFLSQFLTTLPRRLLKTWTVRSSMMKTHGAHRYPKACRAMAADVLGLSCGGNMNPSVQKPPCVG